MHSEILKLGICCKDSEKDGPSSSKTEASVEVPEACIESVLSLCSQMKQINSGLV